MAQSQSLPIDVVSDIVCPWCFIGKKRIEKAMAQKPGIPAALRFILISSTTGFRAKAFRVRNT